MKKTVAVLMMVLWILCVYTVYAEAREMDDVLNQAAHDLVERMIEVNETEGYAALFVGNAKLQHLVEETISADYSAPVRSLVITADASVIESAMLLAGLDTEKDTVLETIRMKNYAFLPSMLNGRSGVEWIAATSAMTVSDVMLLEDVPPCVAYVLTDYGEDRCMTCVSFAVKEGGLTAANANFMQMEEALKTALFEEDIKLLFGEHMSSFLAQAPEDIQEALHTLMSFQVYEGK